MSTTLAGTVMHACIERHGVNPTQIYCLVTGAPIGESYEYADLVATMIGETDHLVDDVLMRVLASMRPSLRWNRMKPETLNDLRVSSPVETLCYLLNRLMAPTSTQRDYGDFRILHRNRIQLWQRLSESYGNHAKESIDAVMMKLLEVEAKLGLLSQESPIQYAQLLAAERPLEAILGRLDSWHEERMKWHEAQEREAKFFAANPGARIALGKMFWEVKPKSEATIQREVKQQTRNVLDNILDELLNPGITATKPEAMRVHVPEQPQSAPRPKTKMPARFGVKKVEG